jgi:hypothetical protein
MSNAGHENNTYWLQATDIFSESGGEDQMCLKFDSINTCNGETW